MPDTPDSAATLLLRLAAPLQSWGLSGQFVMRDTAPYPTKSGVIGLLAAAQGRRRGADLADLTALRFGVRVDQPGHLLTDYHTVSRLDGEPIPAASGARSATNQTKVTERTYLADAVFLTGLAATDPDGRALLEALATAVEHPAYPLALGRRSCPPQGRLCLGVADGDLLPALTAAPWQAFPSHRSTRAAGTKLHLIVDDPHGGDVLPDVPTDFAPVRRRFGARRVEHHWVTPRGDDADLSRNPSVRFDEHEPFALLGW